MNHCLWLGETGLFCDKPLPDEEKFCPHHADPKEDTFWDAINGMYFDRRGLPISMRQWGDLLGYTPSYRGVVNTTLGRLWISTVWLGLDNSFGRGRPVIFETAIFSIGTGRKKKRGLPSGVLYIDRYCTEKEALKGHSNICRMIHSGWRGPKE